MHSAVERQQALSEQEDQMSPIRDILHQISKQLIAVKQLNDGSLHKKMESKVRFVVKQHAQLLVCMRMA